MAWGAGPLGPLALQEDEPAVSAWGKIAEQGVEGPGQHFLQAMGADQVAADLQQGAELLLGADADQVALLGPREVAHAEDRLAGNLIAPVRPARGSEAEIAAGDLDVVTVLQARRSARGLAIEPGPAGAAEVFQVIAIGPADDPGVPA